MKASLLVPLIALALVGGLLGGFAGATLLGASPAPVATAQPTAPATRALPGADALLRTRLDALVTENLMLTERVRALEDREAAADRAPVANYATREELETLRAELLESGEQLAAPEPNSPQFKERVAQTLTAIRKDEAVQKVREYQEQRDARLDDDIARLEEWLELSPYQSNEMRTALLAQYEREEEVRKRWEEGEDPALLGELKRSDREAFGRDLGRFLSEAQTETFWERVGQRGK